MFIIVIMLDIKDIKGMKSEEILELYGGKNPYINYMKKKYMTEKSYFLTTNQAKYVRLYHNIPPKVINKVTEITDYFSEQLQEEHKLKNPPKKILIETLLAESDKAIHVISKLYKNQKDVKLIWIPKTQLIDDIHFEEVDIEVDYEKYQKMDKRGWRAFKHQEEGIEFLLKNKKCILADDMGIGKAEFVNNEVFTPKGRQKIGTLKNGDYVIGSDGKPVIVEAVYPQGVKDLYRVTFNDGYSVLVCKEHLFTVSSCNSGDNSKNRENKYHTISVEQMLDTELNLNVKGKGWNEKRGYGFKTYYKTSNGQNKWQIPIVKPIEFSGDSVLPIEPYLLGVCLGDGYIENSSVRVGIHKDDFEEVFRGQLINENKPQGNVRCCNIKLGESLKELNLNQTRSHTKFIPDIYKYSSIEDRVSILQGLMDTDGHCMKSKGGNFTGTEYCTVSEQLADDVAEIVHSLGGIVRKKSRIPTYHYKGEKKEGKRVYRLVVLLERKVGYQHTIIKGRKKKVKEFIG